MDTDSDDLLSDDGGAYSTSQSVSGTADRGFSVYLSPNEEVREIVTGFYLFHPSVGQ